MKEIKYRNLKVISKNEIYLYQKEFKKFLNSGFYLRSKVSQKLENKLAKFTSKKYFHLLSSGTNSIYLALRALNIKKGDEVLCPSISWLSTATCISYVGAKPIFVDVNDDQNINVNEIESKISKKTKAIIVVNFKGQLCDLKNIYKICKKYGIFIIEDAAQSFGATYLDGSKSFKNAIISCFSFNPMKVLTSFGELGGISTNSKKIFQKISSLQYLGTVNKEYCVDVELNSKSDELQAYFISTSLKNLQKKISYRKKLIQNYQKKISTSKVINKEYNLDHSNGYDYQILVKNRDGLKKYLSNNNIETRIKHPYILTDHPVFEKSKVCSKAEFIKKHSLSLPLHEHLTIKDIDYISSLINKYLNEK